MNGGEECILIVKRMVAYKESSHKAGGYEGLAHSYLRIRLEVTYFLSGRY